MDIDTIQLQKNHDDVSTELVTKCDENIILIDKVGKIASLVLFTLHSYMYSQVILYGRQIQGRWWIIKGNTASTCWDPKVHIALMVIGALAYAFFHSSAKKSKQ